MKMGGLSMNKTLVAYFSASGVTAKVARNLAAVTDADLYEIKPEVPYTRDDLNWTDKQARSTLEMQDKESRPKLAAHDAKLADYDTVFLGFPIWWYVAPHIINTFLETYDFSGKTIVVFATSGGSGFGKTIEALRSSCASDVKWIEGKILNRAPSQEQLRDFVKELGI